MNKGRMKESLSGTAVIEDIEEATFTAFYEFAYRGRYKTPSRDDDNGDDLSADGKKLQRARGSLQLTEYLTWNPDRMKSRAKEKQPKPQSEPEPRPEPTSACKSRIDRVPVIFRTLREISAGKKAAQKDVSFRSILSQRTEYAKSTYDEGPELRQWIQFRSL
ncbi:hypothetical protein PoHVEF18_004955 [Penicillium ochrochloron]